MRCSYCKKVDNCSSVEHLANLIQAAFERHYRQTENQPDYSYAFYDDMTWSRRGEPIVDVIATAAGISKVAALDVQKILGDRHWSFELEKMGEECPYSEDSYYEEYEPDDVFWQHDWNEFEASLKTEARFFSQFAADLLKNVFSRIEEVRNKDGASVVITAGPGAKISHLYRARSFQSDEALKKAMARPDAELGPPPSKLATAGRMNARGISVFYGASDSEVALSEVRPPVGSWVAVAAFEISRPLKLLDLTTLNTAQIPGSIFDPTFSLSLERARFLRSLAGRMTKPIMPEDEAIDYLPTQVVADFLASQQNHDLDGIVYPSAQTLSGAFNVVLFHKSSKVKKLSVPDGTKFFAFIGNQHELEEWSTDFFVVEEREESSQPNELDESVIPGKQHDFDWPDKRRPALKILTETLSVHNVLAIQYETRHSSVSRHKRVRVAEENQLANPEMQKLGIT